MKIFTACTKMRRGNSKSPGLIETAVGDALLAFCFCNVGALRSYLKSPHVALPSMLISTTLYSIIGLRFPGNSENPAHMLAEYAAGLGDNTLLSLAIRFVAQAAGYVSGAEAMRNDQTSGGGGDDGRRTDQLDRIAVAEVVIIFIRSLVKLYLESIDFAPSKRLLVDWMYSFLIMAAFQVTGASKMGISLNPAHKFGEDFINGRITGEHFFLYWFCPLIGAIIAGWTFWIFIKMKKVLRVIVSVLTWIRML